MPEFAFEPLNVRLVNSIKRNIQNTLLLHKHRKTVDDIVVTVQSAHYGILLINLHNTIKNTNYRFNMVFPFYVRTDK